MEPSISVHPEDESLVLYDKGELVDTLVDSVRKHLEHCDACRCRAAELSSVGMIGRLRDAQPSAEGQSNKVGPETVVKAAETKTVAGGAGQSSVGVTAPWPIGIPPELTGDPHYEVMRELGRGGMGVVYLARNKLMDRLEVLKVLNKEMLAKHGTAERFLREIQSAAKLHHPNVVAAYTALRMGELLVFAMEYVEGSDLARLVRSRGPLPVLNACYFALQAAQGLQHAHERGMIHRDIKPGNLILLRQGKKAIVKILDFGLAKVTSEQRIDGTLTQQGQMLGTPDYIAPEQTLDAQKADIRADIYSLGCTLYHLLTGKPPFQGNSLYEVLQAHHSVNAKPLNLVRPDVPVELASVVAKMMAKEPTRRYQAPAEVVQALKPFLKPGRLTSTKPELSPAASQVGASVKLSPPTADSDNAAIKEPQPAQRWKTLIEPVPPRLAEARAIDKGIFVGRRRFIKLGVIVGSFGLLSTWASGVFSGAEDLSWKSLMKSEGWVQEDETTSSWSFGNKQITGRAVQQAMRHGQATQGPNPSYILSAAEYSDFVLSFDFTRERGTTRDSEIWGTVALRAELQEQLSGDHASHPSIVLGGPSGKFPTGTSRWLVSESTSPPTEPPEMPPISSNTTGFFRQQRDDVWHHMEIEVKGRWLVARLNGKELLRTTPQEETKGAKKQTLGLDRIKGRVGLGITKGALRFRNVEINEIATNANVVQHPFRWAVVLLTAVGLVVLHRRPPSLPAFLVRTITRISFLMKHRGGRTRGST
jgi:serine/threonine protein kinase